MESVILIKQDGRRFELQAMVQSELILTENVSIPIEDGDAYERKTPSGITEWFTVLDAAYQPRVGPMPAHYQSKVRKNTALPRTPPTPNVVYNLIGANSRVNNQSSDSSTNVVTVDSSQLFVNMRQAIQQGSLDADVAQRLIERVDALESATPRTKTFLDRYNELITAGANHMTVLAPFIPALTQLLS